ncbi:hypothetical protein [Streptomyces lavendulae]|uniref:hypothetical protein n=1 Tax=Streptomyces lavendulae TaxID=1914 RepID=UPI0033F8F600
MANRDKGAFISDTARKLLGELHAGARAARGTPGLDELVHAGLAMWGSSAVAYIATDPRTAERAYTARVAREIRAALRDASLMQALVDDLNAKSADTEDGAGVQVIPHVEDVSVAIGRATAAATASIHTAHPMVRDQVTLDRAWPMDSALANRGIKFKTIYLDNARTRQPEQEFVTKMRELGAAFRTALPPFERMIIVDERAVFLADHHGNPERKPALMVTHPSLVTLFSRFFLQQWDRAEPWNGEPRSTESLTTPRSRRMLRRLAEGKNIKAIAGELDVSPSTLYADLKGLYAATGTTSEFGLGMWWATSQQAREEREKDR